MSVADRKDMLPKDFVDVSTILTVTATPRIDGYVPVDLISAHIFILICESIKSLQPIFFNLFIKCYNL